MNKELCFIINNNNLFLEHSLVNFNDDPIFFVCSDSSSYYLCLCIDIQKMEYYISKVDATILYKLLNQSLTMKQSILNGYEFWLVNASDSGLEFDVTYSISVKELDINLLPKDVYFDKSFSSELVDFSRELFSQMISDSFWNIIQERTDTNILPVVLNDRYIDIQFDTFDTYLSKIIYTSNYYFSNNLVA